MPLPSVGARLAGEGAHEANFAGKPGSYRFLSVHRMASRLLYS